MRRTMAEVHRESAVFRTGPAIPSSSTAPILVKLSTFGVRGPATPFGVIEFVEIRHRQEVMTGPNGVVLGLPRESPHGLSASVDVAVGTSLPASWTSVIFYEGPGL